VRIFAHRPVSIDNRDKELLEIISQFRVLVFADATCLHWTTYLESQGCRVLFVGTNNAYPGVNRLWFDLANGVEAAVDHLVQLGHRRIAYLDSVEQYLGLPNDKLAGYGRGMRRHKLEALLLPVENAFQIAAYRSIARIAPSWIGRKDRPTAILAGNDNQAVGVMMALHEAGLSVPSDISVMGMDDRVDVEEAPPLTTMAIDHPVITDLASDWIMQAMTQDTVPALDRAIPMRLVVRDSAAAIEQREHR